MYGVRLTAPLYYSQGKQTPWYQSDNHFKAIKNIFFFPVYSTSNLGLRHAKTSITDSYYPSCGIGSMASTGETTTAGSMLDKKKQALHMKQRGHKATKGHIEPRDSKITSFTLWKNWKPFKDMN